MQAETKANTDHDFLLLSLTYNNPAVQHDKDTAISVSVCTLTQLVIAYKYFT